ncbi:MAG: B12-binding domain-containing radical SAM protein [Chitinispirillaceae bacterium]|nr:B12-binding domain-containing radical SAM protein [Chitinispirillaceae bacterium]
MKVTFIMPRVGRKSGKTYVRTWQMEPLVIAVLSALTPETIERRFFDDRIEEIDFEEPTDIAAITVETYTARRSYQIAAAFRKRGVPVVLGGFHVTLMPDEASAHADAVVIGEAEESWPRLLADFASGRLASRYTSVTRPDLRGLQPDRGIYGNRDYVNISLIESGRGCRYGCEFCSISSFFRGTFRTRPTKDVVTELGTLDRKRIVFFVDDNIAADPLQCRELFGAMIPLNIKWVGQVSIDIARNQELLALMKKSGCLGVLVGFESLEPGNLRTMRKGVNNQARDFGNCLDLFRTYGLVVYGTFLFGYDHDTEDTFRKTYRFVQKHRLFFAAFNHLVPFPGTPLYRRLEEEGRLLYDRWWLDPEYTFGKVAFRPRAMSAEQVSRWCLKHRKKVYALLSILWRSLDLRSNCRTLPLALAYFTMNLLSGRDVKRRQDLPLGDR